MSEKVVEVGLEKEPGWFYFLDKDGDVSRARQGKKWKEEPKKEESVPSVPSIPSIPKTKDVIIEKQPVEKVETKIERLKEEISEIRKIIELLKPALELAKAEEPEKKPEPNNVFHAVEPEKKRFRLFRRK